MMFGVELPSYTSKWVYPLIYPLLAIIPGAIGALTVMKVLDRGNQLMNEGSDMKTDLMTWIGIIGANVIVFTKGMRVAARFALFRDPALKRLKYLTPR